MNKKILVGSIISVVILILVSFTGVVGYQTTKSSNIARASPLFNMRINRAIDRDSKDIVCDYVGKGEEGIFSIPKRNYKTVIVQKFIAMISMMDDKTINRFIGAVINSMKQNGDTDINNAEVVNALNQIKSKQELKDILLENFSKTKSKTMNELPTKNNWEPGCLIKIFIELIIEVLFDILRILLYILGYITHDPYGCTIYCCYFPPPSYRE